MLDDRFAEFWTAYPRKVSKQKARGAWKSATKKADPDDILAALGEWVAYWSAKNEPEYVPHPTTWLNGERWLDQPPQRSGAVGRRAVQQSVAVNAIKAWAQTNDEQAPRALGVG